MKYSFEFPTCDIIANVDELTHEEWLALRQTGIGGSDVGAILGISKWRTPLAVYMDKRGQGATVEENEAMYWGTVLEDVVAKEFTKRTGLEVKRYPYILRSKEFPWMLANADRILIFGDAGLECKTAHANLAKDWEEGKVPDDYLVQCYHYMIVTGLRKWHIAVLIGGQKFVHYEIEYNEQIANEIIAREEDFWMMVIEGNPPSAWGEDIDLLTLLYNEPVSATLILDPVVIELANTYKRASLAEKEAAKQKDDAKAAICSLMGNNTKAVCGELTFSWTPVSTTRIDTERLKVECPNTYKEYSKTTESRRFSIK